MATRAQAENYFNTFSPTQQAHIRSTWGGQDLLLEWFNNAVAGGAATPEGGIPGANPDAPWTGAPGRRSQAPDNVESLIDGWIQNIDNSYSREQWKAWAPYYNANCPPDRPFDADPNHWKDAGIPSGPAPAAGTCLEKPIDWGGPKTAAGADGRGGPAVGQAIAGGLLHSTAAASTPEEIKFQDLQRSLEDNLLNREGIFGLADARTGSSGERTTDLYGRPLEGGGLWWGADKGMFDPNKKRRRRPTPTPVPLPAPAPPAPPPPPAPGGPGAGPGGGRSPIANAIYNKFPTNMPADPFRQWRV